MTPAPHLRTSRDVQPGSGLDRDLIEFESEREARRLEERAADAEIVRVLQLNGFDPISEEWQTFAAALTEYGYAVFKGWGIGGVLRQRAASHAGGRGVRGLAKLPERMQLQPDEAHGLAVDLLIVAVDTFRSRVLTDKRRTWRIDGGASLKTYFIGHCLMELPDVYVRWRRLEHGDERIPTTIDLSDERYPEDPARVAVAARELDDINDLDVTIFKLSLAGFTDAEVAEMLDITEGIVRTRKYNARHDRPRRQAAQP